MKENKIHYRKQKHGREFWKINGNDVVLITSKKYDCSIRVMNGPQGELMAGAVLNDRLYVEATEEEFNAEFKDVYAVAEMQKLV